MLYLHLMSIFLAWRSTEVTTTVAETICDTSQDFEPFELLPACNATSKFNCSALNFTNGKFCLDSINPYNDSNISSFIIEKLSFCGVSYLEFTNDYFGEICWNSSYDFCKYIDQLNALDCEASGSYALFKDVIDRYDCRTEYNKYSTLWTCSDCLESYKQFTCSFQLSAVCGQISKRLPCVSLCHNVAARCPALRPVDSYGGQTAFNCPKAGADGEFHTFSAHSNCFGAVASQPVIIDIAPSSSYLIPDSTTFYSTQLNETLFVQASSVKLETSSSDIRKNTTGSIFVSQLLNATATATPIENVASVNTG